MTPLKKFLQISFVRKFLERADRATAPGCTLALFYGDESFTALGDSASGFEPGDPDVLAAPVRFDENHSAKLAIRVPDGNLSTLEDAGKLLDLLSFSLQHMADMEAARRSIAAEALSKYRELALLHRSVPQFNTSLRLRDVVHALIEESKSGAFPGEMGVIYLADPAHQSFTQASSFGFPQDDDHTLFIENSIFQDVIRSQRAEIINDVSRDKRWKGELPGVASLLIAPIASPTRCEGILVIGSEDVARFEAGHRKRLSTLCSVAGISLGNAFNFENTQVLMDAIMQALAEAIDSRDPYTAGHSRRVAQLSVAFAINLTLDKDKFESITFDEEEIRELYYAAILHDVGKIGIREEVLTKETRLSERMFEVVRARMEIYSSIYDHDWKDGYELLTEVNRSMVPSEEQLAFITKLTDCAIEHGDQCIPLLYPDEAEVLGLKYGNLTPAEREEIQRHPAESERILQHIPMQENFANMLHIIRQHHERLDGSGYPDGLSGNAILLQSRIVSIADIFDAVTQERHYKAAMPREQALDIINSEAKGNKVDPDLAQYFIRNIDTIEALADNVTFRKPGVLSDLDPESSVH